MPKTDTTHGSTTRRPWVRARTAGNAAPQSVTTSKARASAKAPTRTAAESDKPAKRFVQPFVFDDVQRGMITGALEAADIGDPTGRAIFIGAIAYELAAFRAEAAQRAPSPPAQPEPKAAPAAAPTQDHPLSALSRSAAQLVSQIEQIDEAARTTLSEALKRTDRFARGYGADYLEALRAELHRIALAAEAADPPAPPKPRPRPRRAKPIDPATISFIRFAAKAYAESLEQAPTPALSGPFAEVLRTIAEATDTPLQINARALKQALQAADT